MQKNKKEIINFDLFGQPVQNDPILRDKFIEPPFSVIDTKTGHWQNRKRIWLSKGIKSEEGRDVKLWNMGFDGGIPKQKESIFDPALCEIMYHWFCEEGGEILDPFAGGSVRGIVANYLGYKYTGIDIRAEQIDSNRIQGLDILPINNQPNWFVGDSNEVLDGNWDGKEFDMVFSCPPYADLEVYSELEGDISNKPYKQFLILYESIIRKACRKLKNGKYAVFVVGEVRDKNGFYYGFVPDTVKCFENCGMRLYNEAILLNMTGSASMRAAGNMKFQKLVKTHQNILIFKKL
jgi:DNA modification methylase